MENFSDWNIKYNTNYPIVMVSTNAHITMYNNKGQDSVQIYDDGRTRVISGCTIFGILLLLLTHIEEILIFKNKAG